LARETAADDISLAFLKFTLANVDGARNGRPMLCEHTPAIGIYLTKSDDLAEAGTLEAERETPDAGEKIEQPKAFHASAALRIRRR
jgi:hypothetical protein